MNEIELAKFNHLANILFNLPLTTLLLEVLFDLENFCRNLVEELQLNSTQHTILFSIYCAATLMNQGTGIIACMDEKLLRQILTNLLSNAIKYSPTGSAVYFELAYQNNEAVFRIRDQGIGIPFEDQEKLFESFHRGRNVGNIPGTGLGLSIVRSCLRSVV